jgi:hypothetical protein
MAEEIQEAVQIIRVAYDGIEIAMKIGGGALDLVKKMFSLIIGLLDYEKSIGKTSMRELVKRGGDLQVFQFKTDDIKQFRKLAKKYGILYSELPDVNLADGMSEIIFHSEAVPRMNMLMQKLTGSKIATFEDYLKNGDPNHLDNLMEFLKKQRGNEMIHTASDEKVNDTFDNLIEQVGLFAADKPSVSVDQIGKNFNIDSKQAEDVVKRLESIGLLEKRGADGTHKVVMDKEAFMNRIKGYQDLADRMRVIAASKNLDLSDVTISKKMIVEENARAIKTRVPGTWGDDARYLWVNKDNIMEIHNGKTLLTFLDKNKEYKLYDKDNRVVETKHGTQLYGHYSKVEAEVREKYEHTKKREPKKKPVEKSR